MFDVTVLSAQQVEALLDMPMALDAVEQAYRLKSTGQGGLFPVVTHVFEEGVADLDIKSGELSGAGIFGLKLVSWFGGNPQRQIPGADRNHSGLRQRNRRSHRADQRQPDYRHAYGGCLSNRV